MADSGVAFGPSSLLADTRRQPPADPPVCFDDDRLDYLDAIQPYGVLDDPHNNDEALR